jgi:molybdopterin-guanine dinucleotide biosynthesis protein A
MNPLGLVLAGGRSRRFGSDKALEPYRDTHLAGWAAQRLASCTAEVVVADGGKNLVPPYASVADGPGAGPAAALLGGAAARPGASWLVLACDLPQIPTELLRFLVEQGASGAEAVVPYLGSRPEPLCALYGPRALSLLSRRVLAGQLALHSWLEEKEMSLLRLEEKELRRFGDPRELFFNVNRPEDLEALAP